MLEGYEKILDSIPSTIMPMMRPYIDRVEQVLDEGVTTLSWTSLQHSDCEGT